MIQTLAKSTIIFCFHIFLQIGISQIDILTYWYRDKIRTQKKRNTLLKILGKEENASLC